MLLGIMTRMLARPTLEGVADAVRSHGLQAVQLNLTSAGLDALPSELDEETATRIGDVFWERELVVAAVSANFNAIHPDPAVRAEDIRRAGLLASRCHALGSRMLTMCTGTRDLENMWRHHPENSAASAWSDLLQTTRQLLHFAEQHDVTVAFEPEVVNVIDSAEKAQRLLEEIGSPRLGVLLDPANLVRPHDLPDTRPVLQDAFARLAGRIVMAHAKDVVPPGPGESECRRVTAGAGLLDYEYYIQQLVTSGFDGALVMHDLSEGEIDGCRDRIDALLSKRRR